MTILGSLLHHSEAIDPTLIEWIRHEIDDITGLEPGSIATILGLVILAFPVWLGVSAALRQRRDRSRASHR